MTQTLTQTNIDRALLTPKESTWLYATRFLILFLSVVGVACALIDGYGVIVAYGFAFLCPIIANGIWHVHVEARSSRSSGSTQPKYRYALIVRPQFFLPILRHIALAIEKIYKIPPEDNEESSLILGEASSFVGTTNKIHMMFGKLQNHVVIASITSCGQVYGIGAYFIYLIRPVG